MPGSPVRSFFIRSFAASPLFFDIGFPSGQSESPKTDGVFSSSRPSFGPRLLEIFGERGSRFPDCLKPFFLLHRAAGAQDFHPTRGACPVHFWRSLCPVENPRRTENCLCRIPQKIKDRSSQEGKKFQSQASRPLAAPNPPPLFLPRLNGRLQSTDSPASPSSTRRKKRAQNTGSRKKRSGIGEKQVRARAEKAKSGKTQDAAPWTPQLLSCSSPRP